MRKEVKYNGYSATPSDYECLDGDLAYAMGVVKDDGSMRPILPPKVVFSSLYGYNIVGIHKTSVFEHYLVSSYNKDKLYWRTEESSSLTLISSFSSKILQVATVGNTIVVLLESGLHYALWQPATLSYISLGNKIPECHISFGLQGTAKASDSFTFTYAAGGSEDNPSRISEQVLAKVNSFIAEEVTGKGKFIYPFFVRYAYRLYDGSLTHHSAPILMIPTTWTNPIVPIIGSVGDTASTAKVFAVTCDLDYKPLISSGNLANLKEWKDIVSSVDIFISAPIYTYKQSGLIKSLTGGYNEGCFYGKISGESVYKIHNVWELCKQHLSSEQVNYEVKLPEFDRQVLNSNIEDCGQFYFLKSIKLDEISLNRTKIDIGSDYLQALVSRELMTDDYQTHDTLIPKTQFVYNSRLNIANIERQLFEGYETTSMICYIDGRQVIGSGDVMDDVNIYTTVNTSDGTYTLKNTSLVFIPQSPLLFRYLFYPDPSATKMAIRPLGLDSKTEIEGVGAINKPWKEVQLKQHSFLNGAFYFSGFNATLPVQWSNNFPSQTVSSSARVSLPNKVYTSEVNNPFHFPLLGINTIGTGDIIGISTAAKALSEGQFGQFPLYAFTSDGVWALEVSSTGAYSARQPITRDVCLSAESITQIDSAVLFASERGIMLLSGSQSQCISNILDNRDTFDLSGLPHGSELLALLGLSSSKFDIVPFRDFLPESRMLYDYNHQHIILYNPSRSYAYVYSLESKTWGMIESNILSGVNAYPRALAMNGDYQLVDYSQNGSATRIKGLFVTRPFKLDEPDTLKTIDTLIQRGDFSKGSVKSILYGSRDLTNWHFIFSSNDHILRGFSGTPYKYFKLVSVYDLKSEESIYGFTAQYTPKFTNKVR
jgi:hypothetical protein